MPRAPTTPRASNHSMTAFQHFYAEWCKERKLLGHSCARRFAGQEWKQMSPDEKAVYRPPPHKSPVSSDATVAPGEDSIDNAANSDPTPIEQEEEHPLFSESGLAVGLAALDESPAVGPSEVPALGPSSVTDLFPFNLLSPVVQGAPVSGPSSNQLSTSIPTPPIPTSQFLNGTDFSLLTDSAYNHLAAGTPSPGLASLEANWRDLFDDLTPYTTTATIQGSAPPTPVPTTPVTGHTGMGFHAPWYTPGLYTPDVPAGLGDNQFVFNDTHTVGPEQLLWDTFEGTDPLPRLSLAPPSPILPAPAPEVVGQFHDIAGYPVHSFPRDDIIRVSEYDQPRPQPQPQAAPPPVFDQNIPFGALQQTFNALNANNFGQEGERLRVGLVGVQLWFAPS